MTSTPLPVSYLAGDRRDVLASDMSQTAAKGQRAFLIKMAEKNDKIVNWEGKMRHYGEYESSHPGVTRIESA